MLLYDQITQDAKGIKDCIKNKLKDLGWSDDDISKIEDELNAIVRGVLSDILDDDYPIEDENVNNISNEVKDKYKSEADESINNDKEKLKTKTENEATKQTSSKVSNKTKNVLQAGNIYRAKSAFNIKEPKVNSYYTSPIDLDDGNYSLKENYPNSYGFIDEAKNYVKVNKEKGKFEIHHQSGNIIKMDKDGNVTIHFQGNLKEVIEGDYTLQINGNLDIFTNNMSINVKEFTENSEKHIQNTKDRVDNISNSITQNTGGQTNITNGDTYTINAPTIIENQG